MPSPDELRQLAERAKELSDKATAGPWEADKSEDRGWVILHGNGDWIAQVFDVWQMDDGTDDEGLAKFIAAARTDVPALATALLDLLAENERLRKQDDDKWDGSPMQDWRPRHDQ